MKEHLKTMDTAKQALVLAWNLLDGVPEDKNDAWDQHMRDKLCTAIANLEVLRARSGADRAKFNPGDRVLVVASIEQGMTGTVGDKRVGHDMFHVLFGNRWANLHRCQLVKLTP